MAHVFISYVMQNAKLASWIAHQLRANGLDPWFSKDPGRIVPGDEWKRVLREAIQEGGYYLPIFTREWAERGRSVANQELMLAAEEARMRPPGRRWIVPVKADNEPLPDIEIGGGRQLSDIQYADIPQFGWERGLGVLLKAMGVENPIIDKGEPIAPGFGGNARVIGGFVTYRNLSVPVPEMEGTSFTVTGGYIARSDKGALVANFKLRAPFEGLHELNADLGLDSIDVASDDQTISTDPDRPTTFSFVDEKDRREAGMPLWMMGAQGPVTTDVDIDQVSGYEATGYLNQDDQVVGTFNGFVETDSVLGKLRVTFDGDFMLQIKDTVAPFVTP
ncbi:toll/interleukin-1 receptor domain-containing protein [Sphingomonas mucosissima]|uniref:TIR domain-containing protein n=1 Tax=Sphingomonas mucosissima TaxID=370959 RepID=A0A245ZPW1_9SPHN|nr:toll/interleukin-1 receptor domain-containing protein [Sphingomonas mucosissima]OWK31777.1 hypothetical protein SPMU_00950 [Sphingomonas mucosissima]